MGRRTPAEKAADEAAAKEAAEAPEVQPDAAEAVEAPEDATPVIETGEVDAAPEKKRRKPYFAV